MKNSESESQQPSMQQIVEHVANTLWRITETWNDYAKFAIAIPLMQALDGVGLQLAHTRGRTTVKQHLQYISNARKTLVSADYYLGRAIQRGLVELSLGGQLHAQMINLAQRIDQHSQAIVRAANQRVAEQNRQEKNKANTMKKDGEMKVEIIDTVSTH